MIALTYEWAHRIFNYNPETGDLTWKIPTANRVYPGDKFGTLCKIYGYRQGNVFSKLYRAHRIIWLYVYGYFPENEIDHINRKRDDNRLCNLREVSRQCNLRNAKIRVNNTSGVTGVCFHIKANKWVAHIIVNNKSKYLGVFSSYEEAVCHRLSAEQCLNWSTCNLNSAAYNYVKTHIQNKL